VASCSAGSKVTTKCLLSTSQEADVTNRVPLRWGFSPSSHESFRGFRTTFRLRWSENLRPDVDSLASSSSDAGCFDKTVGAWSGVRLLSSLAALSRLANTLLGRAWSTSRDLTETGSWMEILRTAADLMPSGSRRRLSLELVSEG